MAPQSFDSVQKTPFIMITTEGTIEEIAPKARKPRKGNKNDAKPKKSLFLDEVADVLIDQLCAKSKDNGHVEPTASTVPALDHLRNLAPAVTGSSGASVASHSTRTAAESACTPATSVDIQEPLGITEPQPPTEIDLLHPSTEARHTKGARDQAVFSLDDFSTMTTIVRLAAQYGRVAHMGILDHSYRFFVNKSRTAALSFKVQNGVAVIGGDPLCNTDAIPELLAEFREYRRRYNWSIAFMGASESFLHDYAHPNGWTTIRFGIERVLNPQTNDVLLEHSGKRIITQNRQLLNPKKGGNTLGVYSPAIHGTDTQLQAELIAIYDAWRAERNCSASPQAFITVYDPFAIPALMTFIYTRSADRTVNGFAALRYLGSGGYHVDPFIAAPGSAKVLSDLLLVASMALLHRVGVSYLGFGFEPLHALGSEDVVGMPTPFERLTRDLYSHAFQRLPISGKKAYHDKFRPDLSQDSALYLVFPPGIPGPRHLLAMAHMANISLRKIIWSDLRGWVMSHRSYAEGWLVSHRSKVDAWCKKSLRATKGNSIMNKSENKTPDDLPCDPASDSPALNTPKNKTPDESLTSGSVNRGSAADKSKCRTPGESLSGKPVNEP